jgi:transcriptional regulator with XRE-family HTH domain
MLGNKKIMGENIQYYMDKMGIDRKDFAKAIDVPYSSLTDWINGKTYPRIDKIERMANYFGISKADLVEERNEDDPYYIDPDTRELAEFLHKNPEYRVLLDASRKLTPDDVKLLMAMIDRMKGSDTND